jgi:5-methylcytosine-specific restriction enzyme A
MATFLLTWKPEKWTWKELPDFVDRLEQGKMVEFPWSTGNQTQVSPGDRFFLLKQGNPPRGIIGSGVAISHVDQGKHWDDDRDAIGRLANRVNIRFETLIDPNRNPNALLSVEELRHGHLLEVNWQPQASGTQIKSDEAARELELRWWSHWTRFTGENRPDELPDVTRFAEGAVRSVYVDRYERNAKARRACIEHYGSTCVVCGFDFEGAYGERGAGFIEVHHLKPLAEVREEYEVDPIRDLRPVCCNCHAMIHRGDPMLTPEELKGCLLKSGTC